MFRSRLRYVVLVITSTALMLMTVGATSATSMSQTPASSSAKFKIFSPGDRYAGMTYGEWSAAWWHWAAGISDPGSPVSDPTGAYCGVNQAGPVWFLAGNTGGTSRRACSVPANKAILIPVINGECSTLEGNGTTEAELAACAKDQIDYVT